jgi:beta-phosphoglucomutase-like phosphatase (HAD superfamily)
MGELPLIDGAGAVRDLARSFVLVAVSLLNRPLIDTVLEVAGISAFRRHRMSEECRAARRAPTSISRRRDGLDVPAAECAAVEDSASGTRAAHAAGMFVVAVPNRHPPAG